MATSEENDLIGYDPLAWMESNTDKNEETINNGCCDGKPEEQQSIDNEISMTDDLIGNAEEIAALSITTEDEFVIDEIKDESDSVLVEEIVDDSVSEDTEGAQIDLDATLTIQNVVKLHEKLKDSLAIHDEIEINASDVSSIDTATLQLLVSLKKDTHKLQKKVTIIYPSPRFVESAQLLGLLDVLEVQDV